MLFRSLGVDELAVFPLFLFHLNGQADVVRVFADQAFELPARGVIQTVLAQVQGDAGAALGALDGFDLKVAGTAAHPAHALAGLHACAARLDRDLVGHDKARIKAHAKLANCV